MPLDRLLLTAARTVWRQRSLWVLGLLATAGGLLLNLTFRVVTPRPSEYGVAADPFALQEALELFARPAILIGAVLTAFVALICFWLISAIAEGGLILAARGAEEERPLSLREALRGGLGLIGRFIGIDTLLFLPLFILTLALMLVGIATMAGLVVVVTRPAAQANDLLLLAGASSILSAPILMLMALTAIAVLVLRTLAFRAAALEDLRAGASIKRAWRLARRKTLSVTLMVLVLWALRSVIGLPLRLISLALLAVGLGEFVATAAGGMQLPAGSGAILTAAGIIVALLSGLLAGLMNAFASTSWTMGYGQWTDDVR